MLNKSSGLLFIIILFAFFPFAVSAQVIISEIMYDLQSGSDTDREWIEVFNAGGSTVHLTDWKLFEANTNHSITAFSGAENLPSGGYAVIADNPAKFLIDSPGYGGLLFDSTFGLNNSGETLAIHTPAPDLSESDSVSYQSSWGAAGNGNSLQRNTSGGATFSEGAPAPGTGNLVTQTSNDTGTSTTSTTTQTTTTTTSAAQSGTASAPVSSYVAPPEPQIFADAGSDRIVIVAADTIFAGRAYNRKKEAVSDHIRFSWNFGDGSTAEGASVLHHFDYPGRYAVVLNITENMDTVSDQVVITAEPAKLSFTSLSDGSVAIQNLAGRDLDLSNWIIRSLGRQFILPKDSIILSNETLRMGDKTLGFRGGSETELDYPNGALALRAADYSQTTAMPVDQLQSASFPAPPINASFEQKSASTPENDVNSDEPPAKSAIERSISTADEKDNGISDGSISSNSQVASAASVTELAAGEGAGLPAQAGGSSLWWLGAFGIALAGSGAVYAARLARRRESLDSAHDKLLEGTKNEPHESGDDKSFDNSLDGWKIIDDSNK